MQGPLPIATAEKPFGRAGAPIQFTNAGAFRFASTSQQGDDSMNRRHFIAALAALTVPATGFAAQPTVIEVHYNPT